jgi:hypothetical protein
MFGTLQDRLIKELAKAGIGDIDAANAFIRDVYLPAHNARFARPAALAEEAFVAADPALLAEALCVEEERVDNTVTYGRRTLQLPASPARAHWRASRCANIPTAPSPCSTAHAALRAAARRARRSPRSRPRKRDTVLAAVKDAARRLRRWRKRAILDGACARRHWARAGRDMA